NILIESPGAGTVIDDDIANRISAKCVVAIAHIHRAAPEAHVTDDDVVRFKFDGIARDANPIARRGLPRNRQIRRANDDAILEIDDARDVEDDNARAGRFERLAKGSGAGIFKGGHDEDLSAAPTEAELAAAFSSRECG